ncbi:BMP family ABC transporter substrate-binding protein, partial [Enterococcus faecalis]|uniref:BMP family ABC transporter substrate-binding protein n=1 Tax=Enterococcus faecalis TaxID=1351 RepID=UPI003D6C6E65
GVEGRVIGRFEAGFEKGVADAVKKLGKDIQITSTYAGTFADASKRRALASSMYQAGADIIYHAAATTEQGIFQESKALNQTGSKDKIWVIGVVR